MSYPITDISLYNLYLGNTRGKFGFWGNFRKLLGLVILICAFSAIGILASSIAKNQITAYLFGVFLCFIMFFGIEQLASYRLLGGADFILQNIGFYRHYIAFERGLIDSRDIFYFIFIIFIFIKTSIFLVERKK